MTHPEILEAMRTGGEKSQPVERNYPVMQSKTMDKSNRFYKQVKKLERLNNE